MTDRLVDETARLFVIHSRGTASRGEYEMLNAQPICTSVVGLTLAALLTAGPVCDRAAGTCTFELEGVIVYDASDQS